MIVNCSGSNHVRTSQDKQRMTYKSCKIEVTMVTRMHVSTSDQSFPCYIWKLNGVKRCDVYLAVSEMPCLSCS